MDITYNKVDQTALPIAPTRVSASEYNQIAASLMHIITSAGLTPDSQDNAQLLNALGPRIVETYSNGTSWYRVWSDGWCEQGGYYTLTTQAGITISLLKQYANADYTILTNLRVTDNTAYLAGISQISVVSSSKTTSSFGITTAGIQTFTPQGCFWSACGYIS